MGKDESNESDANGQETECYNAAESELDKTPVRSLAARVRSFFSCARWSQGRPASLESSSDSSQTWAKRVPALAGIGGSKDLPDSIPAAWKCRPAPVASRRQQ